MFAQDYQAERLWNKSFTKKLRAVLSTLRSMDAETIRQHGNDRGGHGLKFNLDGTIAKGWTMVSQTIRIEAYCCNTKRDAIESIRQDIASIQ